MHHSSIIQALQRTTYDLSQQCRDGETSEIESEETSTYSLRVSQMETSCFYSGPITLWFLSCFDTKHYFHVQVSNPMYPRNNNSSIFTYIFKTFYSSSFSTCCCNLLRRCSFPSYAKPLRLMVGEGGCDPAGERTSIPESLRLL
jgi:hypothetical protein